MTELDFDAALDAALDKPAVKKAKVGAGKGRKLRAKLQKYLDEQLDLARADPVGWTTANKERLRLGDRPRILKRLVEDVPEFSETEHAEFLTAYLDGGVGMSEEWKARLLKWIERAIPILKFLAGVTPPPYNLIILAIVIVLTLIAENRLQPAETAAVFASGGEAVPGVAV